MGKMYHLLALLLASVPLSSAVLINAGGIQYRVDDVATIAGTADTSFQDGAEQYCDDTYGMALASFHSTDMYREFLSAWNPTAGGEEFFIGLRKVDNEQYVTSMNGAVPGFVNFAPASYPKADVGCAKLVIEDNDELAGTPWYLSPDCTSPGASPVGVICSDQTIPPCDYDFNDFCDVAPAERDESKMCFWNPAKNQVVEKRTALKKCQAGGGHLLALFDGSDLDHLYTEGFLDDSVEELYWIGLTQGPDEGAPRWRNGSITHFDGWADNINFGSSLSPVGYTGLLNSETRKWNLYIDAPPVVPAPDTTGTVRSTRLASVICETPKWKFCLAHAPEIANGHRDQPCCDNKITYHCNVGYEFVDGTVEKEYVCDGSCDPDYIDYKIRTIIKGCVVRNPCHDEPYVCGNNSYCVFTNEVERPYYCKCEKGYQLHYGYCADINECEEGIASCPSSPYGGCINRPGGYECYCSKEYSWGKGGKCEGSIKHIYNALEITLIFTVDMDYDIAYTYIDSPEYLKLYIAVKQVIYYVFGAETGMAEIRVRKGNGGLVITAEINLSSSTSLAEQSRLAYDFLLYIRESSGLSVDDYDYPYIGYVYFQTPSMSKEIAISSLCSLFDATGYCHGSPCYAKGYLPACKCKTGYRGGSCEEKVKGEEREEFSSVDIGLMVGLAVLFLFVLLICLWICSVQMRMMRGKPKYNSDHEIYQSGTKLFTSVYQQPVAHPIQPVQQNKMWGLRPLSFF